MAPSTTKQWTVTGTEGFDALKFDESAAVPEVGDKDVLVKGNHSGLPGAFEVILIQSQSTLHLSTTATWSFPKANTHSQ